MNHSEFHVGLEFWCGDRRYRCTDVGGRVVVAIRGDCAEIATFEDGKISARRLSGADAAAQGWFAGPPYAVQEIVFDEYDLDACSLNELGAE